jgi:hypothetical protein
MRLGRLGFVSLVFAGALTAAASAQPVTYEDDNCNDDQDRFGQVNISGATLFNPFFRVPASTNDFIDANCDGVLGYDPDRDPVVDQLASNVSLGSPFTTFWAVQQRSVGSVNGYSEFIDFQLCGRFRGTPPGETGLLNRAEWARGGVRQLPDWEDCLDADGYPNPDGDKSNDSGTTLCPESIDIGILDVPSFWGTRNELDAGFWSRNPGQRGYGVNSVLAYDGWESLLASVQRDCLENGEIVELNFDTADPDESTIYDTTVAWAIVTYNANRGVGRLDLDGDGSEGDINMLDIKHLFVAGRTRSGENLAVVTRSSGSGTRNAVSNTSGIDPAWHRGDNLDNEWAIDTMADLGPSRKLTNGEASGNVERALHNSRLGVGYTGLFGSRRGADDANAGLYEILNVKFDDRGGSSYVRPDSKSKILKNCDPSTSYQIGGEVTFASRGDPFEDDSSKPQYMESRPAAWYLRNIQASVDAFESSPGRDDNNNMPGEYLANVFTLVAACDCLPQRDDPDHFVENAGWNELLQGYTIDQGVPLTLKAYGAANAAGLVPFRIAADWSDGTMQSDGQVYRYYGADRTTIYTIAGGKRLGSRNRVQGDFDFDGKRNIRDIAKLIEAVADPLGFEKGKVADGDAGDQNGGNVVIAHILGDFNGTGELDSADVRYFADGLALDPEKTNGAEYGPLLDRKLGFAHVDEAAGGNFFSTKLATPKVYAAGDSRGDVAGNPPAPGADPRGWDRAVDAKDIDYIYANFGDWQNLDEAVFIDLSADMTGPIQESGVWTLKIDQLDVDEIVRVILGTEYGDANLDGKVDEADEEIVRGNLGETGLGWAGGDFNGDGIVDVLDLVYFDPCSGVVRGDSDGGGSVDFNDIDCFVAALIGPDQWESCGTSGSSYACANDINQNGSVDFDDIDGFVECLVNEGCP